MSKIFFFSHLCKNSFANFLLFKRDYTPSKFQCSKTYTCMRKWLIFPKIFYIEFRKKRRIILFSNFQTRSNNQLWSRWWNPAKSCKYNKTIKKLTGIDGPTWHWCLLCPSGRGWSKILDFRIFRICWRCHYYKRQSEFFLTLWGFFIHKPNQAGFQVCQSWHLDSSPEEFWNHNYYKL